MQLQTHTQDIHERRLTSDDSSPALAAGDVCLAIDRFAFTANNVTYGAVGEQIGYWRFFPPTLEADDHTRWGMIPVWGFATVTASEHADIQVGERVYGYLPMATEWVMRPGQVSAGRWVDTSAHRADLPPVYNSYQRLTDGPADAVRDNLTALLMPLYGTAFCLVDALSEQNFHGATQVLIGSASSKTSLGLAYGLRQLPAERRPKVVGLTSPGNRAFLESIDLYDQIVTYDGLDNVDSGLDTVIVDMSGNRPVLSQLHQTLGERMRWCHYVGLTHIDAAADRASTPLIDERSGMFFAPGHIQRRSEALGSSEWNRQMQAFTNGAVAHAAGWLDVREIGGLEAFLPVYDAVIRGELNAREGLIVKL